MVSKFTAYAIQPNSGSQLPILYNRQLKVMWEFLGFNKTWRSNEAALFIDKKYFECDQIYDKEDLDD